MQKRIKRDKLQINDNFYNFINKEILPGINIAEDFFWDKFSKIIYDLTPINQKLLKERNDIQSQLDSWHKKNRNKEFNL